MELQPHQKRVVDEKQDLDNRIQGLSTFIDTNPTYKTLPPTERDRMQRQLRAMITLSWILGERIDYFNGVRQ